MEPSGPAHPSQFLENPDESSGQSFLSLDLLARALHVKDARLEPALQAIVATAVDAVGTAQHAGLITVTRGVLVPLATTGPPPQLLDQLQGKLKHGPCFTAANEQVLVRIEDMRAERRWPGFAPKALSFGVHSMLCVPLWVHEQRLGALSLYSDRARAFSSNDERITTLFATLAAIALAEARRTDQLHTALANRDVIGQAKGILMERHKVTGDVAFGYLADASQQANLKLTAVAGHLIETGELPGDPHR